MKLSILQKNTIADKVAFTLLELMVVIVILGILATITINYRPMIEPAINREAIANLKLIAAAERIYKIERSDYYPEISEPLRTATILQINTKLKLFLPAGEKINWSYSVLTSGTPASNLMFRAMAQRVNGPDSRVWRLENDDEEPCCSGGRFCEDPCS